MKSLQEIQTELKDNQEFQAMDVHQAILDIGYAYWQNPEERTVDSYLGMINFVKENYGELFAVSILLGKYNQQVCNGGHIQYFDNGYADGIGGFGKKHDEDIPLHHEMIAIFKNLGLEDKIPLGDKFLETASKFKVLIDEEEYENECCDECMGSGRIYNENPNYDESGEDSEEEIEEDCPSCDGNGEIECGNDNYGQPYNQSDMERLDDEYYQFNEEFMKNYNEYLKTQYQ